MSSKSKPLSGWAWIINELEETAIAVILAAMTVITFINVVMRYGFNSGLDWGLHATAYLFAWLVIFGASYAMKTTANLGVDALVNLFSPEVRRVLALISGAICIAFAALLVKGAWDAWANFANLPKTEGRWFPVGFEEMKRSSYRGYADEVNIPMVDWLRWLEPVLNDGERYEKFPMVVLMLMLPLGCLLLLYRSVQATWRVWTGEAQSLIVSHEVEDAVDEIRHAQSKE